MKHSPLPWRHDDDCKFLFDKDGCYITGDMDFDDTDARFIVLACNHFNEMREFIATVESCSGWQKDSEGNYFEENGICPACVEDASKLLAKLEEADV